MKPAASVIITTYNQPLVLDLTLRGYRRQSTQDFELIIADDGSGDDTRKLIEEHSRDFPVPLIHVWQPDDGYHKSRAVNRATLRSQADLLIFSDGDCIPAQRFVEDHLGAARPRGYTVGGHIRLTPEQTENLTPADVEAGRFEEMSDLRQQRELRWTHLKSVVYIAMRKKRKPKFYGLNFSVDRDSFFEVNGFDETYQNCGREDSDLRNRLQLAGVGAKSLWNLSGVFHQHHPSHNSRLIWTEVGAYYNRKDITAVAPAGLAELRKEIETQAKTSR